MPSDTYILTISEAGVSAPSTHASTHLTGGSDPIPVATSTTSGIMSAAIFNQHTANTAKVSNVTHTGDVTDASGVLTVNKINGVSMAGLATGIVKNTTGTGVPSIAVAADFPTLNQSTTGNAATATTATSATNLAGGAAGTVPYQTGSGATAMLAAGTAGYVLKSNGSAAPSWAPVDLSAGISGSLPVSSGGTGAATFTAGVLKANGTSAFTSVSAPIGDIVGTTDIQTLTNKTFGVGTVFSNPITVSNGGTGANIFNAGILTANGTNSFTTIAAPSGAVVGTTDLQTLSNKTFGSTTALGTPISGTLTNCTGLQLTTGVSGILPVANGGTGTTTGVSLTSSVSGILPVANGGTGTTTGVSLTSSVSGILPVANGGTGQSSYTIGDILYANTTTTTAKLAGVATGNALISGGIGTAPSYGKIGLTTHVSGTLAVTNGGTGVTTSTGSGANVLATSPTLVTPVLGTPTSGTLTNCTGLSLTTGVTGILPVANGGTGYGSDGIGTLSFDITPDTGTSLAEGQLRWNATDKTLDLKMTGSSVTQQIGQEVLIRATASQNILNGQVVYIDGSFGGMPEVGLASNNSLSAKSVVGVATENINIGESGYITLTGLVRDLNLSGYTSGQEVWLSTSGGITAVEPSYPAYKVRIGYVAHADNSEGVIYVAPKYFENGLVNGTGKIGYINGSGGSIAQNTSKTTGVTLNKTNGQIIMNNAALSANTTVSFTLTNSKIETDDVLILNHISGGSNFASYVLNARSANGSATIDVRNVSSGSLAEAIVISFVIIKATTV